MYKNEINNKTVTVRFKTAVSMLFVVALVSLSTIGISVLTSSTVYAEDPAAPAAPADLPPCPERFDPNTPSEPCALPDQEVAINCPEGNCIFEKYINPLINTLSALVGVAVTISIIVAGIRYGTSADNSQKVSEAKQRMVTSILVLIGYFLFYAFLNYIIPGGLIGGGP